MTTKQHFAIQCRPVDSVEWYTHSQASTPKDGLARIAAMNATGSILGPVFEYRILRITKTKEVMQPDGTFA